MCVFAGGGCEGERQRGDKAFYNGSFSMIVLLTKNGNILGKVCGSVVLGDLY